MYRVLLNPYWRNLYKMLIAVVHLCIHKCNFEIVVLKWEFSLVRIILLINSTSRTSLNHAIYLILNALFSNCFVKLFFRIYGLLRIIYVFLFKLIFLNFIHHIVFVNKIIVWYLILKLFASQFILALIARLIFHFTVGIWNVIYYH